MRHEVYGHLAYGLDPLASRSTRGKGGKALPRRDWKGTDRERTPRGSQGIGNPAHIEKSNHEVCEQAGRMATRKASHIRYYIQ